jgi:hypothetical protein
MKGGAKYLFCGLLLLALSTTALAQGSLTLRIPAAIAAGEYAEAEMLIVEALKTGIITPATAEVYRRGIEQAMERSVGTQQSKKRQEERKPSPRPPYDQGPETEKDTQEKQGRVYVTYTKLNKKTHRYYAGRTSMVVDLKKPLYPQALEAIRRRDANHHLDENDEPKDPVFALPELDKLDQGSAVDYGERYRDAAYLRIRGREQQLIDSLGGAWSDAEPGQPYKTENAVRGVARNNPRGREFYDAASDVWGRLGDYTGY